MGNDSNCGWRWKEAQLILMQQTILARESWLLVKLKPCFNPLDSAWCFNVEQLNKMESDDQRHLDKTWLLEPVTLLVTPTLKATLLLAIRKSHVWGRKATAVPLIRCHKGWGYRIPCIMCRTFWEKKQEQLLYFGFKRILKFQVPFRNWEACCEHGVQGRRRLLCDNMRATVSYPHP